MIIPPARALDLLGRSSRPMPPLTAPASEAGILSEPNHLELIRSYAGSGFTAVLTINSGAPTVGLL
jgi:hypothetical protein